MNEQFEELMYESGLTAQGCWDAMDDYDRKAIETLCELIVRECARKIEDMIDNGWYADTEELKKHFGVEL
jgi:hypothetical protein